MKTRTATKPYRDKLGNKIKPVKDSMAFDDRSVKIGPLSADEEKIYRDLIDNTCKIVNFDDTVLNIINEEAADYFAGRKSLDETADIIQNRVTTYVNEKR